MFWGLVLKANRKYTQTITKSFHLSQASLDITTCTDEEPVQLFLTSENNKFLLCTLRKNKVEQITLDLNFSEGDVVSFQSHGSGNVHLGGYIIQYPEDDMDDLMGGLGEEEEDESEDEEVPQLVEINPGKKSKKERKAAAAVAAAAAAASAVEDEDDEDDSDFEGGEEEDGAEEEDDGEEEEDDDDDDDDEEDESDEEEVQEPKAKQAKMEKPKVKQNGLENGKQASKPEKKKESPVQQQKGGEKTLSGGVKISDVVVGKGDEAKAGKKVQVYYEGRLKSNNKVFDSTKNGAGFKFKLGQGEVIKGWDVGVAGMKVGGKRRITCPPHMAYGARGSPPVIPSNSTLVFEVELKKVL